MIVSVTLNPCIDKTVYLDRLTVGEYNRVRSTRTDVCGKGVNMSIVLSHFGIPTCCTGFNFKENGRLLEKVLEREGIPYDFVTADGEIRTNIKLFDRSCQDMTEINEAGPLVPPQTVEALLEKVEELLEQCSILVLSGSIPPGVPTDIYGTLIRMAHRKNVKTVLDAAGEPFLLGLKEKPCLIKPNDFELAQAFPGETKAGKTPLEIARNIIRDGVSYVCVSMGGDGALFVDESHAYQASPLPIEVKGLTGAGDSMVAGMCCALHKGLDAREMLRYACAAAAGSVRLEGTLLASLSDLEELLPQVEITPL